MKPIFRYTLTLIIVIIMIRLLSKKKIKINYIVNDLPGSKNWMYRPIDSITDITIHHTAGPLSQTSFDFARYHIEEKGWPGIGYHFVINAEGRIDQTNDLTSVSYHNGYNNTSAIGIALIGNFNISPMTDKQKKSMYKLIDYLKWEVKGVKYLMGHREYKGATDCPGFFTDMSVIRSKSKMSVRPTVMAFQKGLASIGEVKESNNVKVLIDLEDVQINDTDIPTINEINSYADN